MADRYWIATTAQSYSDTNYWSTTSGGSGGASVPGASDKAIFDSNGQGDCAVGSSTTVQAFDSQDYTGTITISGRRSNFIVDGGSICRIGANTTITGVRVGSVTDVYFDGTGGSHSLRGTCTLHTCNDNIVTVGYTTTAANVTIGLGPIRFSSNSYFGLPSYATITIDNTVNSTPLYINSGTTYIRNANWNDTGGIYPTDTNPAGSSHHLSIQVPVGPIIIDPDEFANISASSVGLVSSSGVTCTYLHDCYGIVSDYYGLGITETGVDPNPCRDVAIIGSATVAKL